MFCLELLCVGVVGVGWGIASTTSRNPPFKEYNVGWLICESDTKNRIVSWTFSADHTMPIQMGNVEILQVVRIVMLNNCMIQIPYSNLARLHHTMAAPQRPSQAFGKPRHDCIGSKIIFINYDGSTSPTDVSPHACKKNIPDW